MMNNAGESVSQDTVQELASAALNVLQSNGVTHLAQLEAAGNQAYIFATNRLRENVGASFLLGESCSAWVEEVVADSDDAFVVAETSGRALLAGTHQSLRDVITAVTTRVLIDAPGLIVTGSITEWNPKDDGSGNASDQRSALGKAMQSLSEKNEQAAGQLPASLSRFRRLPPVADCAVSFYPAEHRRKIGDASELASEVSYRKHSAGEKAWEQRSKEIVDRLDKASESMTKFRFTRNLNSLAEALANENTSSSENTSSGDGNNNERDVPVGWLAVVHIDGSGVGKLFIEQSERSAKASANTEKSATELHLQMYFTLSLGLEKATETAVDAALNAVARPDGLIPVVPLVVGGDDVTAVCLGRDALRFTETYLRVFEEATAPIARDLQELGGPDSLVPERLSACAGVAIVKPNYPFHLAYELAETLISNAKAKVKQAVREDQVIPSAYDVHVLNDSSAISLADIRAQRRSRNDEINLWGGPYVVGEVPEESTLRSHAWLIEALGGVASITTDGADGGSPEDDSAARSSLNRIKEALFQGRAAAIQAHTEAVSVLPDAIRTDLEAVLRRESAPSEVAAPDSCGLADVLDLFDIVDLQGASGNRNISDPASSGVREAE